MLSKCGGIFSNHIITNFFTESSGEKNEKRSIFDDDMDKSLLLTLWATLYMLSRAKSRHIDKITVFTSRRTWFRDFLTGNRRCDGVVTGS